MTRMGRVFFLTVLLVAVKATAQALPDFRPQWTFASQKVRFASGEFDGEAGMLRGHILVAGDISKGRELARQERPGAFTGTVSKVLSPAANSVTLLTFHATLNQALVGYVLPEDYPRFPDLRTLKKKRVLLRGTFALVLGRPQIRLTDPSQITILSGQLPAQGDTSQLSLRLPTYPAVSENPRLLRDAVVGWNFQEGDSNDNIVKSALPGGLDGSQRWGIWLNDPTFGKVLDFSTEGSYFKAPGDEVGTASTFSLSVWMKAPVREVAADRVIISQGNRANFWRLKVSQTRSLVFESSALRWDTDSGYRISDGKWHHVLVTYDGRQLANLVDRVNIRTIPLPWQGINSQGDLYVGSNPDATGSFFGSISRVRLYNKIKTSDDVTSILPPNSDNRLAEPVLKLKRGIVLDRRQYAKYIPPEYEKVYPQDVANCRNMGFDHMKVLFTPNHLMNPDGSVILERLSYIKQVVDTVVAGGMSCLICIHPEVPFKQTYLVEGDSFERLIRWYRELANFIGAHWGGDQVALQLMTEPYGNQPENRWTWMSDRMYGAVRNVLPDHTIVTSSDRSGNLERLKAMRPATDSNLIYSFTTYEPYTAGFNVFRTTSDRTWKYLRGIPYPANPTSLGDGRIAEVTASVPDAQRDLAHRSLRDYASGKNDGDPNLPNLYGGYYNAEWHQKRAKSLREWSARNGGVHLMCVEFGCMDSVTARRMFARETTGDGVSASDRIQLIGDLRRSFEANGIGWSYWSYNDPFTVFLPEKRIFGKSPDATDLGPSWFDYDLLESALGLTPLLPKSH